MENLWVWGILDHFQRVENRGERLSPAHVRSRGQGKFSAPGNGKKVLAKSGSWCWRKWLTQNGKGLDWWDRKRIKPCLPGHLSSFWTGNFLLVSLLDERRMSGLLLAQPLLWYLYFLSSKQVFAPKIPPSASQESDSATRLSPGVSVAPKDVESRFCGPQVLHLRYNWQQKDKFTQLNGKDFFR